MTLSVPDITSDNFLVIMGPHKRKGKSYVDIKNSWNLYDV